MKRYVFASLVSLITVPTMADNWIKFTSQAVEDTINTIVAQECRQAAADEYQKQMDQTTGKISVIGIYKVCSAACKDIRSNKGYSDCRYFINQLAEKSGFGTKSATQANCANTFNGIWSLTHDGKEYQCVGKDGFKLVYQKSCDKAGGDCIKDFASLKTQGPVGREFIAEYAKKKNLNLTCKVGFETRRKVSSPLGQDYIMCSAGGKSYEFEFDSLNQDVGKTSIESENKALCEFFGGKIVKHPDSSVEKDWQSCDIARNKCEGSLHDLALRIGHTNMYQGYCRLSREAKSTNEVFLNHIDGVDNYVFYKGGAQMRADMAKVQAEEYLRNTFPKEGYIHCGTEVKKLEKPGVDPDFVMTCTVGSKQVDFVFADLTEGGKKRANTGVDAMQCIISGGTFNGESCRGPTKDECTKLDVALRAKGSTEGTYWDDGVRACILGNAMKTYKADVATNYIVGAVVIVGSALLVIGTDGLATPVVVENLALLAGDAGINYAIDWNHRRLSKAAANRFSDFIDDADKCTDEQCALNVLKKHYATLSDVMNDLNKDDQATVDAVMDRLIELIQTEFVACGKNDSGQTIYAAPADCAMQSSTLRAIDYIDKASEPVLIIGSIIYNPGWVTSRFIKVKKVSKVAKDLNVTYKDAKQLVKTGDTLHDVTAVATKADDAADATSGRKLVNADSPESEVGFENMMNRVDESNSKNLTPEDIEAEFIRRQAETGAAYTETDVAERMQNYNDYYASHNNGKDTTRRRYSKHGVYTEDRKKVHEKILDDLFKDADNAKPATGEQPTFVILGGRGGSGKSQLDGLVYDGSKTIVIDPDEIKTMLPEYKELVDSHSKYAGLNAWEVHDESADIVQEALAIAKERGINVVLDGTMPSAKSAMNKIIPFEEAGYRIEGGYMFLPREESAVRALERGMDGRFVPVDVLLKQTGNENAFGQVSEHFDSWAIWTTDGVTKNETPWLIGHSENIGVFERGDGFEKLNNTDIDLTTFGQ